MVLDVHVGKADTKERRGDHGADEGSAVAADDHGNRHANRCNAEALGNCLLNSSKTADIASPESLERRWNIAEQEGSPEMLFGNRKENFCSSNCIVLASAPTRKKIIRFRLIFLLREKSLPGCFTNSSFLAVICEMAASRQFLTCEGYSFMFVPLCNLEETTSS